VATWLRTASPLQPAASHILKNLMKSLPLITHWISWKPDNGYSILIRLDKILGIVNSSLLSSELLLDLKDKNVRYLYQAIAQSSLGFITNQWKSSEELDLSGNLATEWFSFCKALIQSGVQVQPRDDSLIWTGGDHSGILTVKKIIMPWQVNYVRYKQ
jgi:hypothetical protein